MNVHVRITRTSRKYVFKDIGTNSRHQFSSTFRIGSKLWDKLDVATECAGNSVSFKTKLDKMYVKYLHRL